MQVLDVSGNGLDSLSDFHHFESLIHFTATNNAICDLHNLKSTFYSWLSVTTIDLSGNPVCSKPKYRDQMLVICPESVGKLL